MNNKISNASLYIIVFKRRAAASPMADNRSSSFMLYRYLLFQQDHLLGCDKVARL